MELMASKTVDDYTQRALTTIRELRESGIAELDETLRPYRIQLIENMLQALKELANKPTVSDDERRFAHKTITEIEKMFLQVF